MRIIISSIICLGLLAGCGGTAGVPATAGPQTRFADLTWSQWLAMTETARQGFIAGLLNDEFGGCPALPPGDTSTAIMQIYNENPARAETPNRVLALLITGAGCTPTHH